MPVYSSHLLQFKDLHLGDRIREARQRRGLTLRQLGGSVGISVGRLSEIENELYVPDLRDVQAIASALELATRSVFPEDVRIPYQITQERAARSRPPVPVQVVGSAAGAGTHPHDFWPVADLFTGRHLEPVLGRIRPLSERDRHFCSHHEEEFLFVLKGGVEFRCRTPDGLRREELSRGDCLYFRSDLPHCLASLEADPAETVHVLAAPSAPAESGFDWATWGASAVIEDNGASSAACAFGRKLRALRETRGWSVDQLARKVELGERQLQRIERGERAAPLDVVLRLARAFGKPFSELVTEPSGAGPHYFIQRSSEIARLPSRTRRTPVERPDAPRSKTCQPLASGFPARHMYPYFIRLLNVDMETLTFHEHHGHEFIYVLDGELELRTYAGDGLVTEMLLPGDCCYLDSTVPHLVRGQTRNPYSETSAEVIDVFWSPLGETYLFT